MRCGVDIRRFCRDVARQTALRQRGSDERRASVQQTSVTVIDRRGWHDDVHDNMGGRGRPPPSEMLRSLVRGAPGPEQARPAAVCRPPAGARPPTLITLGPGEQSPRRAPTVTAHDGRARRCQHDWLQRISCGSRTQTDTRQHQLLTVDLAFLLFFITPNGSTYILYIVIRIRSMNYKIIIKLEKNEIGKN